MIYSCFVSYLTYMIVDRFGTVLSFYVLYYCIIIQCSSYLATWLPFLINRLDWTTKFTYFYSSDHLTDGAAVYLTPTEAACKLQA